MGLENIEYNNLRLGEQNILALNFLQPELDIKLWYNDFDEN